MYNLTPGSLRASSPGVLAAGRVKEEKLATTSLEFEFLLQFPCGSSSTEVSYFHQSVWRGNEHNVNKHWKTCAKKNDIITNVTSANQHIASTFSTQIFKFQRRRYKLFFLLFPTPPPKRRGELACKLDHRLHVSLHLSNPSPLPRNKTPHSPTVKQMQTMDCKTWR